MTKKTLLTLLVSLVSSRSLTYDDKIRGPPLVDNSTYANTDQIYTDHVHLDLALDFDTEVITGSAKHSMIVKDPTAEYVQFDIWDLEIQNVIVDQNAAKWWVGEGNPLIGQVLRVATGIDATEGQTITVQIDYTTSPTGQAFSWLTKEQTAGGQYPYMFTQCEDINCRSVAPLQDTPSNRITYSASVTVPDPIVPYMSANSTGSESVSDTHTKYNFENSIRIPSYLIAVAAGNIEYRSMGERVGVITEPEQMDAVAWELEDMGDILDAVEAYMGPYIWGNYTIIVLPPSFPMGGMENPLLTFASPTIIVGDRSQVYVATHEMAHSWTGNEVTCRDWENFWLNEGFTVFIERKVSGQIHGEDFAKVEALLGNTSMWSDMENFGLDNTYASIHPVLRGDNPDHSFSELPYEKGFQFLHFLEGLIGEDQFQAFLNYYIRTHSLTSITSIEFRQSWEFFVERMIPDLTGQQVNEILSAVNFERWINKAELAPADFDFTTTESDLSQMLAQEYVALGGQGSPEQKDEYFNFYSNLKVVFHDTLLALEDQVTIAILERIDADLGVTADVDPEVRQRWYALGLSKMYDPVYDPAHDWISSMGRSKYLNPIYESLQDSGQHDLGVQWFDENKDFYHPVAATSVEEILGIQEEQVSRVESPKKGLLESLMILQ